MPDEDVREKEQMWARIDEYGGRLSTIEQRVSVNETRIEEHGRQLSDMAQATSELHRSSSEIIGGIKALKQLAYILGIIITILQLTELVRDFS